MGALLANRTVIVPAGATGVVLPEAGRYVKLVSCSVASVLMGFDGSTPERVYPDDSYAGPTRGFASLRFVADVGACVVVVQVSQQPILGGTLGSLAPLAASLVSIDGRLANLDSDIEALKPAATINVLAETVIAQTGNPATVVLAAAATRKWVALEADSLNAGSVYLCHEAAGTKATAFHELTAGGTWRESWTGAVWAVSANGTELVRGYETT